MNALSKRLKALEAEVGPSEWASVLDSMNDADLLRLEAILGSMEPVSADAVTELSDDDAAFLAGLIEMRSGMVCTI